MTFVPYISHTVHFNNLDSGGNPSSLAQLEYLSHGSERVWKGLRGVNGRVRAQDG